MRTPSGLSIMKVEWPMNVSRTWSALSAAILSAAGRTRSRSPATSPGQASRISGFGSACDGGVSEAWARAALGMATLRKAADKTAARAMRANKPSAPTGDKLTTSPTP